MALVLYEISTSYNQRPKPYRSGLEARRLHRAGRAMGRLPGQRANPIRSRSHSVNLDANCALRCLPALLWAAD